LFLLLCDHVVESFDLLLQLLRGRSVSFVNRLAELPQALAPLRGQPADLTPERDELDPGAAVSRDRFDGGPGPGANGAEDGERDPTNLRGLVRKPPGL